MKFSTLCLLTFVAVGAMTVASCHRKTATVGRSAENVDVALPVVDSVTLYKTYPGTMYANREVKLVARVNGYLESKNYNSGDFVKQGTVLFTIESRNYRDAVEQARSNVETARANLAYAQAHYDALAEAVKSDAVSRMEVEQGRSALEQAKASLASAEASLTTAQTQLGYCTVRAPFDGHVSGAIYDVGSYVGGEGAPVDLASIYEDAQMVASFSIDDDAALVDLQHNIETNAVDYKHIPLKFNDDTDHSYTGSLDYLAPHVNTSTGTIELQALVDNPYGELRSGMYVSVDLPTGTDSRAILVKDASISSDQLGKYLYTVNDSGRVAYTPIETGQLVADSMRIVTKGIEPGTRYVTKALLKVRDGMTVNPVLVK